MGCTPLSFRFSMSGWCWCSWSGDHTEEHPLALASHVIDFRMYSYVACCFCCAAISPGWLDDELFLKLSIFVIKAGKTWWQDEALFRGSKAVTVFAFKAGLAWLWNRLTTIAETLYQVSTAQGQFALDLFGGYAEWDRSHGPQCATISLCKASYFLGGCSLQLDCKTPLYMWVCVTQYSIHLINVVLRNGPECMSWCHFL